MEARQEEIALRRRRIVEAAVGVLGEVSVDRLTMEMVAERADTATRTIYNHFPSREELIAEAFGSLLDDFRDVVRTEDPVQGGPREQLHHFVERLYDIFIKQGNTLTTLMAHREVPGVDSQIREMRVWRRGELERIFRGARGELQVPLQQAVAMSFVLTNHATWLALVDECGLSPAKALALTTETLDTALFKPAAR
jgi:AcrR family transcriptional regulator